MNASAATDPTPPDQLSLSVSAVSLLARARGLRARARHVNPVVAEAYHRRASELELEAWLRAVRSTPVDIDHFTRAAA